MKNPEKLETDKADNQAIDGRVAFRVLSAISGSKVRIFSKFNCEHL